MFIKSEFFFHLVTGMSFLKKSYINHSLTICINWRGDALYFSKNSHYLILIVNIYICIKFTTQIHKYILNMILFMVDWYTYNPKAIILIINKFNCYFIPINLTTILTNICHRHILLPSSHNMVHFSPFVLVIARYKKDKLYISWISKSQTIIFYYIIFNFWFKTTALFLFQFLWMTLSFISRNSCSFTTTVITPILLMLFLELPSVCTCQRLLWILISINMNVDIDNWEVWLGTGRVYISPFLEIEQFVHHTSPRPP